MSISEAIQVTKDVEIKVSCMACGELLYVRIRQSRDGEEVFIQVDRCPMCNPDD